MAGAFHTQRLHLDSRPAPSVVAAEFRELDELEAEVRARRQRLDAYRQAHMMTERCWGIDLRGYRKEMERRAGQ